MSKFETKDKLDSLLFSAYNILSEIKFLLSPKIKSTLKNNSQFKGMHKNERCFILGTGPSLNTLTEKEIDSLKNEVIIGTNSLYKASISKKINPTYYTLIDNLYWGPWHATFETVASIYPSPPTFITDFRAQKVIQNSKATKNAIYIHAKKFPTNKMSHNLEGNIYAAMNVVSFSIIAALYMGFSEIYLLGCDYNAFCTSGRGHAYDDKKELSESNYNLAFYLRFYWITTEFHYLIAKLAAESGAKVINLTPNSLLDAYPRATTSEVIH